jgi:hypothetical protein
MTCKPWTAGPLRWLGLVLAACGLAACVSPPGPGGPRHSPAQIAGYTPNRFASPLASAAGAARAREEAMAQVARASAGGADDATVMAALRSVAFYATQQEAGRQLLASVLGDREHPLPQRDPEFQRAILTATFTLDAQGAAPLLAPMLEQFPAPRQFAIAAYTLRRADGSPERRQWLRAATLRRGDTGDPRLRALLHQLEEDDAAGLPPGPPLADLLAAPFTPGLPVVFSVHRHDRRYGGLAVVRGADGRFVRNADGQPFHVPHLALALSGLPATITLGNTPQGVFTVVGAGTADNPWIGPTPVLESKVPVEAGVREFFHGARSGDWTPDLYTGLLPPSWRGQWGLQEAWLAGLAGRDEMLLHGGVADPAPYRGQPYYPGTPTDGCVMALEDWSPDGRLLRSDQLDLVRAFTRDGQDHGYAVVVELDAQPAPVRLPDLMAAILAAEARLR